MGNKLLLSTFEMDEDAKSRLIESLPDGWEYRTDKEVGGDELPAVEILLLQGPLPKDKLPLMTNLRLIQSFSAGVDHVDFGIIPQNVIVCSNGGAFGGPIGEFVFGAVISLGRNLFLHDKDMREGKFVKTPQGIYLKGRTIGILGTGGIGQNVARLAKSFGMTTAGVNTSGQTAPNFDEVTTVDNLNPVLQKSDVIVVAVPLTMKTRNLLGKEEFLHMKPDCIIVNVARGAIISQEALYNFLRDHPEAKAAIDVWWRYPNLGEETVVQDYPISSLPNVLSSPHNSDGVEGQLKQGSDRAVENIIRYFYNEPLKGIVNREDYIDVKK
jgi:D-3-phosphoglycerate dehydrogenase